ncbi:MAG: hypothetical protein ACXVC6_09770 [Bacteroidia bacterium]
MKPLSTFFVLLISLQCLSQNPIGKMFHDLGYKDGLYTTKHPNGKSRENIIIKNGNINGRNTTYSSSGVLTHIINWNNGHFDGSDSSWTPKGNFSIWCSWRNDTLMYVKYYKWNRITGKLKRKISFKPAKFLPFDFQKYHYESAKSYYVNVQGWLRREKGVRTDSLFKRSGELKKVKVTSH